MPANRARSSTSWARSPRITCATSTSTIRCSRSSGRACRGRRLSPRSSATARPLSRRDTRHEARAARAARRRVLQRSRDTARCGADDRRRRHASRRHAQQRRTRRIADDDIVEVPVRITLDGPVPLPQSPLAPELLGLTQHVAAYERLAVAAAISGDRKLVHKALIAHPLIGQMPQADRLLESLLTEGAEHLPVSDGRRTRECAARHRRRRRELEDRSRTRARDRRGSQLARTPELTAPPRY